MPKHLTTLRVFLGTRTVANYPIIETEFNKAKTVKADIDEHIDKLYELALECDHIVEGGVRYVVSTWAFLLGCASRGGIVVSYCYNMLPEIQRALDICAAEGVKWEFHDGDWLQQTIPETDLLFIDTNHEFWQLTAELSRHAPKARKYIVMHDTESFRDVGADGKRPGMWQAVQNFVDQGKWRIKAHYPHQNGLTILERVA